MGKNSISKSNKIIFKYIEYILTKFSVIRNQRIFFSDNVRLKYMLKKNEKSNVLIVVFSSCTRKGLKARYNYVRTLEAFECNKLFILDDFASDHRGSYYLGKDFCFNEEKATEKLIQSVYKKLGCDKILFCGSSKGGYAALNFGLMFENSIIIAGAPQYYLADYLEQGNQEALDHIIGNSDIENRKKQLNKYLEQRIINNKLKSQKIYIHYSNKEHTYFEHIQFLMKVMHQEDYVVSEDIANYTNHSDISLFFPDYLRKVIREVI